MRRTDEPLTYSHWSKVPMTKIESAPTWSDEQHFRPKPRGFWLSVDGEHDWEWWCNAESFALETFVYHYRIFLKPDANILFLRSAIIYDFTIEHRSAREDLGRLGYIEWKPVMERYQGLVIAPYQWGCRLDPLTFWYYGWDCASGCIWGMSAQSSDSSWSKRQTRHERNYHRLRRHPAG